MTKARTRKNLPVNNDEKPRFAGMLRPIESIKAVLPSHISINEQTYQGVKRKAEFCDIKYGTFIITPEHVMRGQGHPKRRQEKRAETNLKRYGGSSPANSPDILAKMKKTSLERYGTENARSHPDICAKIKKTNLERYGVEHVMSHPDIRASTKKTNLERYGHSSPMKNPAVAKKCAQNQVSSIIRYHWKTQEELICQSSWEVAVVEWLATHQIDFDWQQTFNMPCGHTYRVDLYLKSEDTYVEIKGLFRKDAKCKWDWFHAAHPNSELWQKAELKQLGINIK